MLDGRVLARRVDRLEDDEKGTGVARPQELLGLGELLDVINTVVAGLLDGGITDEEHEVAVGYLTGSMLLGLEDTASRMARLGNGEITRNEVISIADHLDRIRSVTVGDVHRVLQAVLGGPRASVVVGPLDDADAVAL